MAARRWNLYGSEINHRDAEQECFRKEVLKQKPKCPQIEFRWYGGGVLLFVSLYLHGVRTFFNTLVLIKKGLGFCARSLAAWSTLN